jgi:hypothetical protein
VFIDGVNKDGLLLAAARASRIENQDAIDASIVGMLGDPKEVLRFFLFELIFFYCIQTLTSLTFNS